MLSLLLLVLKLARLLLPQLLLLTGPDHLGRLLLLVIERALLGHVLLLYYS